MEIKTGKDLFVLVSDGKIAAFTIFPKIIIS